MVGKPKHPKTMRIGILVFQDFEPIDVFGFIEPFAIARFLGQGYSAAPPYPFETVLIAKKVEAVRSMNGPSVMPDWDFDRAREEPLDVLMVPGGLGVWPMLGEKLGKGGYEPLPDNQPLPNDVADLLRWMRYMDKRDNEKKVRVIASVCIGAAVLARCGFLDGLPATTNHQGFNYVAHYGPEVLWDNVARWVDAGRYVTSAGVSAGTDLGFHLVSRLAGRAVAEIAAKAAEYDWHRDPNQPVFYPQQADF